jgi:hypothetical protein
VFGLLGAFLVVNRRLGRDYPPVVVLLVINLATASSHPTSTGARTSGVWSPGALRGGHRLRAAAAPGAGAGRGIAVVLVLVLVVVVLRTAALTS